MVSRVVDVDPIVFAGPVGSPEAVVDVPATQRRAIAVDFSGPDGVESVRVLTAPAGAGTLVRLVLSEDLAAGRYDVVVRAGDLAYPGVVEVPEQAALEAVPTSLDVLADGGTAPLRVTIVNTGNSPVEIRGAYVIGLIQAGALDAAIGAGLGARDLQGMQRFERVADELAQRHGGATRIAVTGGAGSLEPGARVEVVAELRLGDKLEPDRRYTGTWSIGPVRLALAVRTAPGPVTRARAKKGARR